MTPSSGVPPSGFEGSKEMQGEEVSREFLMRYMDGELSPEERRRVEAALERSTELRRELAIFRSFHDDFADMRLKGPDPRRSIWERVNRKLARPMGWLLLAVGGAAWVLHVVYVYVTSPAPSWEKAATSAIVIGILLLFATVIHDRYRELLTDPYRDVRR